MTGSLKQFVPSNVCLKCDGCCRFQLNDSPWRPKTGEKEMISETDPAGYVKAISVDSHAQCAFFNKIDSTCSIYSKRPFECSLYPFIVSRHAQEIKVYMHLACPYIQEKEMSPELKEYASYLQDYFKQDSTKSFLKENGRLLHDYSAFEMELKFLFNIEV